MVAAVVIYLPLWVLRKKYLCLSEHWIAFSPATFCQLVSPEPFLNTRQLRKISRVLKSIGKQRITKDGALHNTQPTAFSLTQQQVASSEVGAIYFSVTSIGSWVGEPQYRGLISVSSTESLVILTFSKHLFWFLSVPQELVSWKDMLQELSRNTCDKAFALGCLWTRSLVLKTEQ